jgi:hypothetical protein
VGSRRGRSEGAVLERENKRGGGVRGYFTGGPWKFRVFWAPNGTRLSARCHFTGPKKLSISRAQPPPTCPRNVSARIKNIAS